MRRLYRLQHAALVLRFVEDVDVGADQVVHREPGEVVLEVRLRFAQHLYGRRVHVRDVQIVVRNHDVAAQRFQRHELGGLLAVGGGLGEHAVTSNNRMRKPTGPW